MKELKKYLTVNCLFSGVSGLIMLLFSNNLNEVFGIDIINIFPFIGVNLLIFAAFVWYVSTKQFANKMLVTAVSILDLLWVLGSLIIVIFGLFNLTENGYIIISIVAIWIAFLAYKQFKNNK